jgi:hypothetical protein
LTKDITDEKETVSLRFFEDNALAFLEEVYKVMNGEILCAKCKKTINYNTELKTLLPPTIRLDGKLEPNKK